MTSTPRPFRFAVQVSVGSGDPVPTTAAAFREMARRTEALGYTTLFVGDHYVDRGRITQFLAPMAALGVASRPAACRTCSRSKRLIFSQRPLCRHLRKW